MPTTSLTDFIFSNIEPILKEWDVFAEDVFSDHQIGSAEARDHARGILVAIATDMERAQTPQEQAEKSKGLAPPGDATQESEAAQHGAGRFLSGFSVTEQVSEFRALRASVLRLWSEANPDPLPGALDETNRFNEAIDQALAESVARYSAEKEQHARLLDMLLSSSPDLNYVLGLDGTVIYANKAVGDLYGTTPAEIIGKPFSSLDACLAAEFQQHLPQIIDQKVMFRGEVPCTPGVDKKLKFEHLLVPVINGQGEVEAVAGTARNMTDRNKLEDDLKREKSTSDTIIESAPGPFYMIDPQFHLARWNRALKIQTGLSDEQLRGSSLLQSIHEGDREFAAAKFLVAFATGYARMEVRVLTRDQGVRYYLKTARRIMVDGVPYLAGFSIDVTDRKTSEAALEMEKTFSDAMIESVPSAFYVIDVEGNYVRWNNYLDKLTGLTNNKFQQRPLLLSIDAQDRALAAATMKEAFESGYAQAELRVMTQDQGTRPFFMTARRFQVGDSTYLVGVGTDTTQWLNRIKNLEHDAWTDPLTQVANRSHFMEMAKLEFGRCRRYGHPLSLWMLDIDHFKDVNDTYGHHAGDLALRSLVETSQHALRDWDILGRVGGEEFAVLLPETQTDQALLVTERLRQAVASASTPLGEGKTVDLTVSIGIATVKEGDADVDALLSRADKALYEAKQTGRDKVCLAEP